MTERTYKLPKDYVKSLDNAEPKSNRETNIPIVNNGADSSNLDNQEFDPEFVDGPLADKVVDANIRDLNEKALKRKTNSLAGGNTTEHYIYED